MNKNLLWLLTVFLLPAVRPAELLIEQPTKFDLVINLNAAKKLASPYLRQFCIGPTQ